MKKCCVYKSPLGNIFLEEEEESLTLLMFESQYMSLNKKEKIIEQDSPLFQYCRMWLDCYFFEGRFLDLPKMKIDGSFYRKKVTELLLQIPYGKTVTYGELAKKMSKITGKKPCSQAIGQAVSKNKIAIMIPCHRVVGKNNQITGYAGGIEKKIFLLNHESKIFQKK